MLQFEKLLHYKKYMNEKIIIPISIVVAGAIIGAAVMFSGGKETVIEAPTNPVQEQQKPEIRKVSDEIDHIKGSTDADLYVVEYSDLECPFCKRYNDEVLSRLENEYKDNDRISFVFRHFPLDSPFTSEIHPTATDDAVASECVADLNGDEAFFAYKSELFADTSTGSLRDADLLNKLSELAVNVGVDKTAFENCYAKQDLTKVTADFNDGRNNGVEGTPTVFVQQADGTTYLAVADYNVLKQAIEVFLQDNK